MEVSIRLKGEATFNGKAHDIDLTSREGSKRNWLRLQPDKECVSQITLTRLGKVGQGNPHSNRN